MAIDLEAAGFAGVDDYQRFNGLPATGVVDRVTARSFEAPRFCKLPDKMDLGGQVCKWGHSKLTWFWGGQLPGIDETAMHGVITAAWRAWEAVCGITAQRVESKSTADVSLFAGREDGSGRTLAWAELPCGQDRQRQLKLDVDEPWVVVPDPPRYRVSVLLTLIHELGHILGLEHGPPGTIMQPVYDPSVKKPTQWDIAQVQSRYGDRIETPGTGGGELPPAGGEWMTIDVWARKR